MVKRRLAALAPFLLLAGLAASPAFSHSRGESYSRLRVTGGTVDLSFSMRVDQFLVVGQRLLRVDRSLESQFLDHVLHNFHLRVDGRECVREDQPDRGSVTRSSGYLRVDWRLQCPPFERLEVEVDVLMDVAPGHLHRVRLRRPDGTLEERLLLSSERVWSVPLLRAEPSGPEPATIKVFPRYLGLGIQHIVLGVDHLAFLLAVLLSTLGLRATLWAITGFTVGHSITLC
ncbi:MAG: HupE/UreJ family protein, partial [Candidatus Binatia bacterium]